MQIIASDQTARGRIQRFELASGVKQFEVELKHDSNLYAFSASESGKWFAVYGMDKTLRIHDADTAAKPSVSRPKARASGRRPFRPTTGRSPWSICGA